ncbi:MAG: 30S ribosomal protein S7 [Holosporales bacterium]|jgi:small subunit ribosomal protein S7|nr:30S ribosomal protein S7 [Holosporales bacterium]
MSRRRAANKREIVADTRFGNVVITKFINTLMYDGKRSVAEKALYSALSDAEKKIKKPAVDVFSEAINNVKPNLEVRSKRVGGATYQVPSEVRPSRSQALAIRWIISSARGRAEKTMQDRLCAEILDACNGRGNAIKKRDDMHRMAEANRAFAHYRW